MNGIFKKTTAEFFGTFWLVFGGCGSAVLAAAFPELGIGFVGVSLAFGLTVVTMAYAVGHISGGHFNPAISFGLWAGKRFSSKELLPYIIAQVLGGIFAGLVLYLIASGKDGFSTSGGFASTAMVSIPQVDIRCFQHSSQRLFSQPCSSWLLWNQQIKRLRPVLLPLQ